MNSKKFNDFEHISKRRVHENDEVIKFDSVKVKLT